MVPPPATHSPQSPYTPPCTRWLVYLRPAWVVPSATRVMTRSFLWRKVSREVREHLNDATSEVSLKITTETHENEFWWVVWHVRIFGSEKLAIGRHISVTENSARPRLSLQDTVCYLKETWHTERFPKVCNILVLSSVRSTRVAKELRNNASKKHIP